MANATGVTGRHPSESKGVLEILPGDVDADDKDRLAIIRDAYRETANVGDDVIRDGARAIDNILSAGGDIYSSFREAILEFAEANYLLIEDNLPKMYEHSDIYADVLVNGIAEADVSPCQLEVGCESLGGSTYGKVALW